MDVIRNGWPASLWTALPVTAIHVLFCKLIVARQYALNLKNPPYFSTIQTSNCVVTFSSANCQKKLVLL